MNLTERVKLATAKGYIQATLDIACETLGVPTPKLAYKPNLRTCAGRAYTRFTSVTPVDSYIEINERMLLLNSKKEMSIIVRHELAHIIANLTMGERCGHNEYWRTAMSIISGVDKQKVERCHSLATPTIRLAKRKETVAVKLDLSSF